MIIRKVGGLILLAATYAGLFTIVPPNLNTMVQYGIGLVVVGLTLFGSWLVTE
jgi:hypothetical protein